jgi:Transposase IS116/IS110/IS902 family
MAALHRTTGLFGVGPVIAAAVIGDVRDVGRFPGRDHFAACNGTAPIEVSSGRRKACRLSRRGNRRINHAIHMAAITQIRNKHSRGRAYYDKKLAEGKTPKEALRSLKRQVSNAIFACLQAGARRAAARAKGPGGQQGNDSVASAAGSHPRRRLFGQATPGSGHHPTTAASVSPGKAARSPVAATLPPATPKVQVERPQRSEDERPGGEARRRPYSAARKARGKVRRRSNRIRRPPHAHRKDRRNLLTQRGIRSGGKSQSVDMSSEPRPNGCSVCGRARAP